MNIALIGATGNAGSRILSELIRRGHSVTAIVRHPERLAPQPGVTARKGDVFDQVGLAAQLKGQAHAVLGRGLHGRPAARAEAPRRERRDEKQGESSVSHVEPPRGKISKPRAVTRCAS